MGAPPHAVGLGEELTVTTVYIHQGDELGMVIQVPEPFPEVGDVIEYLHTREDLMRDASPVRARVVRREWVFLRILPAWVNDWKRLPNEPYQGEYTGHNLRLYVEPLQEGS